MKQTLVKIYINNEQVEKKLSKSVHLTTSEKAE